MISSKDLILEDQLSFIMYACSKETIKRYKPYLDKLDLTYTQYITMLVLWNGDNLPVNELGKRLYLDSGTVTPMLKKLEMKGLIQRIRNTEDERTVFVKLTGAGRELEERVRDIPEEILLQTGIPVEEANEVIEVLKSILDRVNVK